MGEHKRIVVDCLTHNYDTRCALDNISFNVASGEVFCLLGPNGSGKTTLFKILSTRISPTSGNVKILGFDLNTQKKAVRKLIGVVFQNPGLDTKLTVNENLRHQGHLYGINSKNLNNRIDALLDRFDIADRKNDIVEELSGGLKRRVDLAKALLHKPKVLILDEPSSGLDIGVRNQLSQHLKELATQENIPILLTTHLLDEAEGCNRVGILDKGRLVAIGTPDQLKSEISGDVVIIESESFRTLAEEIQDRFDVKVVSEDNSLRIETTNAHEFVRDVVTAYPNKIKTARFGKPTLADVFIKTTGNTFD